jgi:tRNA1(Val) A37 N6-methylase TrmN6
MRNKIELAEGERLDDLLIGGMKIIQHKDGFCFSLDAILLGHFAGLKPGAHVVELGAGTGVVGFVLAARGADKITGIELDPDTVERAARSIRVNGLEQRMEIFCGDLRRVKEYLPAGHYELVVSNPPYRPVGAGLLNSGGAVAIARHEITACLQDVIDAAKYLVKYRGRFAMVHLPERMPEILTAMGRAGLEPKRLRLVHPRADKKPNMLLVEGILGAKPGLSVLPPLIVYKANGSYADEIMEYYA